MIKKHEVEVAKDYRCPLCMELGDESYFIWEGIIETPICDTCSYELCWFLMTPPDEGIWFGSDLHSIDTSILEKITGKSMYDLQMSYVLSDLDSYHYPKKYDEEISDYYANGWSEDEVKQRIREKRRGWIQCFRHRKKLIRKLIRLKKKMQEGIKYHEGISKWYDARHINKGNITNERC